jgi:hypothetical protein
MSFPANYSTESMRGKARWWGELNFFHESLEKLWMLEAILTSTNTSRPPIYHPSSRFPFPPENVKPKSRFLMAFPTSLASV